MRIQVFEPGDPGGDPVADYRGVTATRNDGSYAVVLARWPQHPIGAFERVSKGNWVAWLTLSDGVTLELIDRDLPDRKAATYAVLAGYHFRFRAHKGRPWHTPSRKPVDSRWDLLPPGLPWGSRSDAMGQLHRFLGVNRRLFDKPSQVRPYAGAPYAAADIEEHPR